MTTKHDVASYIQMMTSMITMMRYTPNEATWHRLNHFLPCMGILSYSYKCTDSLKLCDDIENKLGDLHDFARTDIFLFGKCKTNEIIAKDIRRRRRCKRRRLPLLPDPKCHEITANDTVDEGEETAPVDTLIEETKDEESMDEVDMWSESEESEADEDEFWPTVDNQNFEEMEKKEEKRILKHLTNSHS